MEVEALSKQSQCNWLITALRYTRMNYFQLALSQSMEATSGHELYFLSLNIMMNMFYSLSIGMPVAAIILSV